MGNIIETPEYKKERRKRFGGPIGASMSAMDMNDARKESFEQGVEWCARHITAQHDKEMESFANWILYEDVRFDSDSGNWIMEKKPYTFPELLALFRNRNK